MKDSRPEQEWGRILGEIAWTGAGLHRPECVLTTATGLLYVADWRGGVTEISPDGKQRFYSAQAVDGEVLKPNGLALRADGTFLLAHLGDAQGGVFSMRRDGTTTPFLQAVGGIDLPPTNFVVEDAAGRVWITVSTRRAPRALGYRRDCDDGFIVLVDGKGARIVADHLGYTNECLIDRTGKWLYVNETFGRRLTRFDIRADGSLDAGRTVTEFGAGTFPDGLAQDSEGQIWTTSIVSNRLIRISPDGGQWVFLEDCDPDYLLEVERAFTAGVMSADHLRHTGGRVLRNISSLAFGGPDMRTGYLGCLQGDSIATLRMPVPGQPMHHWDFA